MPLDIVFDSVFEHEYFIGGDILGKEFEKCHFISCNFTESNLQSTVFIDCIFTDCIFSNLKFGHVSLRNVHFLDCECSNANFVMTDQVIYEFHFTNCKLDYSLFYNLKLENINFINCSLISADFMKANLVGALFDNCNLHLAVFDEANCATTDFYSSYHISIDPTKTKLKKAIFSKEQAKNLLSKFEIIVK